MKRNLIYNSFLVGILCLVLVSSSSCKKALEADPYSSFTSANFFENENQAYMATLGIYQSLGTQPTYAWYINQVYDNDTDISQIDGTVDVNPWRALPHYAITKESTALDQTWVALNQGVDRANVVLAQIPQMASYTSGTDTQKATLNRLLGEAKFLRGYCYFDLVRLFGDVPFKLTPSQAGENFAVAGTDRYVIYNQIIKDMKEGSELLPATLPTDERINKWGAKAVLARVALYAGGFSLRNKGGAGVMEQPTNYRDYYVIAKEQIDAVIGSGLYSLNPSFAQVFKNQNQSILEPKESLFEIAIYNQFNSSVGGNTLGTYTAPIVATGVYKNTNGRVQVMKPFFDWYNTKDLRRDFTIAAYTIDAAGVKNPLVLARAEEGWKVAKWSREYQANTVQEQQSTNINTVLMRYADVLLMRAEVENELSAGPNSLAYDAINEVRRRGFGVNTAGNSISIQITTPGSGYTAVPIFTITGGGGTGAIGSANLVTTNGSLGPIIAVTGGTGYPNTVNAGYGYTSLPTIVVPNPWPATVNNWTANTDYTANTYVKNGNNYYRVTAAGKSNGTGPTHTTGNSTAAATGVIFQYASPAVAVVTLLPKPTNTDADLPSGLGKQAFFDALTKERAMELCFEGGRKGDLIRWNLLGKNIALTKSIIRSNYSYLAFDNFKNNQHELYPFPAAEVDVNKVIIQNPGY
jgi:hypothetical protein